MITAITILFTFICMTLIVIIVFPKSFFNREDDKDEDAHGFFYQIKPLLSTLARFNAKINLTNYKAGLQKKMIAAGDPMGVKLSPDEFIAFAELSAPVGILALAIVFGFSLLSAIAGATLGFLMPHFWLTDSMKKRKYAISRQLPDFLDLLTLTVEAGLDFNAATARILKISKSSPLIHEFKIMMQEIKLGATRYQALKAMANRVDIPDFSSFVSSLLQTDKLGASLGPTLRVQADQMRIRRMQMAEKAGAEASVKLLVPLMLFIFPAVFIMLFGPILIEFLSR